MLIVEAYKNRGAKCLGEAQQSLQEEVHLILLDNALSCYTVDTLESASAPAAPVPSHLLVEKLHR